MLNSVAFKSVYRDEINTKPHTILVKSEQKPHIHRFGARIGEKYVG